MGYRRFITCSSSDWRVGIIGRKIVSIFFIAGSEDFFGYNDSKKSSWIKCNYIDAITMYIFSTRDTERTCPGHGTR